MRTRNHHRLGMSRQEKHDLARDRARQSHTGAAPAPATGFAALATLKDRMAATASAPRVIIRVAVRLPRNGRHYITAANGDSLMISPDRGEALRLFSLHDAEIVVRQAIAAAPPGARAVLTITTVPAIAPAGAGPAAGAPAHPVFEGTDNPARSV